ncbi:fibronectin type III domain-containing protein [Bernardetia litoralis DSM 6794]|uniref:Fibronectin type III domain-containing protein n=1 Tax=Bernardetia litoralis (strain ATCC 23117 / DSM 6794 / NBRC 15988 / NCIMB 1366 / Fx l1 / Sio-4) TaxID=880071 RepID=I4AQE7_BERLS|nr:T9SS type A sorting domain-containing protein [Bernardetia litoralis]AFM06182.1 fibronectin type III domain-containing protein [Bernardetia litoralis DSM 6794]
MQTALLKWVGMFLLVLGISTQSYAQIPFTENFTAFTGTGFAPIPAAGQLDSDVWKVTGLSTGTGTFGGTHDTGDFARGASTGDESTGGIYSFDVGGGNNTLGAQLGSSDFTPGSMIAKIENNTGAILTSVTVAYDIYYNNNATRGNSFNFSYSSDDVTYTNVATLDFATAAAADALGWQTVARTTTITGLSIPVNGFLYVSWTGDEDSGSGSRDELALDNVSVTVPTPPTTTEPMINEFVSNHTGNPDTNDFIEIFGIASTDYSALTVIQIEGDANGNQGNIIYAQTVGTTDANGYWTTGYMNELLQGGNAAFLLVEGFTGALGDDLDSDNDGTLNATLPWTTVKDEIAVSDQTTGTIFGFLTLNANFDGVSYEVGGASRIPNGTDTNTTADWKRNDFDGFGFPGFTGTPIVTEAVNTLGAENMMYVVPTGIINVTESLTAFTTTALNVASATQTYEVSGTALTDDITITAPSEFQVSLDGITFTSSVIIPFATANAGNTTVYVQYLPTSGTSHTGDITNVSTGATSVNIAITGTVPPSTMTIAIARTRPVNEVVTIEGVLTVADQLAGPAFIQDATGGIAVYDAQIHGGTYPIGQLLRITATRTDFSNQIQLSNVTSVTDLGAGTPVVPQVITLDQLDAHRGELVQIASVTFPDPNTFLFGNSNYSVTNGANLGDVRIDGDTDLAGRSQPTVCDVTGVVAYYLTASQLIPRFQADLPCTNPYTSPSSSTVTACIALPKTLEVSTYNVEWFGYAQGGTPSGNTSPADQKAAVKAVIEAQNSDIYFLEEINNTDLMGEIAAELTASTPDTWDTLFSYYTSYAATFPIAETQKVGFLYKSNIITPQFSYAMHSSIHPLYNGGVIDPALVAYPESNKDRFWASGRLPFMMRADVALNGGTEEVNFIVLHSRSGSAQDKYDMRRFDVTLLQDSISAWLGNDKVIMGGDYNDDVDESIYEVSGVPQVTSYDAFTTRPTEYTILSKDLSDAGFRSTVGFSDMIDHLTVSNELANGYIPNSVSVGYEYYDGDYEYTTSDHFIVSARLEIVPLAPCTFTATPNSSSQITLDWADNSNIETTYVVEMSLNGTTGWTAITGSPFAANSITNAVAGLNGSTQYFFRVRAEEAATNFSEWVYTDATTLATTTPPTGGGGGGSTPTVTNPTNFRAIAVSTSQINLTWSVANGATGYTLYRGNVLIATLGSVTSFQDTGLMANTFYSYRLVARNGNSQSSPIQANARTFPDAPSLLSVTDACSGSGGIIRVTPTGVIYRVYEDSVSTMPLFESDNTIITIPAITQTTTFYVSAVSTNDLESTRTAITVNVNQLPTANILEDRVFSCASTGTITAEEVVGASYTWLINGFSIMTTTTPTYEVNNSGNYQVRVTLNGCSAVSDITPVRLNFAPVAQIAQGIIARSCEPSTIISAINTNQNDSTTTYEWTRSNVVVGNTASVSVSESGTYTLTVTQNGCSATDEIVVEISTINPNISFSVSQETFCPEEEVMLTVDNPEQNVTYTWMRNGRILSNSTGTEYITSVAGEYRVQASQNSCAVISAPIMITRTRVEPVYLRKEDALFVESITPITDVVWFLEGEEVTSLAGQMSFIPTVSANYSARVTFNTGCNGFTRTVYYSVPEVITGEEEIIDVETIVYPNPSKTGIFRVQLSSSITSDVTFTITDNIGRVLENRVIKANEISTVQTLDLSQYAAGMYALTIDTEQGTVIKKIIVE